MLFALVVLLGVSSVTEIADPRPGHRVTDQAGVLSADERRRIDEIAAQLHDRLGVELAVVTVDRAPETPKQLASALFARWKLGSAETNTGILMLLAVAQRRIEIETGIGIEAALSAAWLAGMQRDRMVPAFKAGRLGVGLIAGVEAIDAQLRSAPAEAIVVPPRGEYRSDGAIVPRRAPERQGGERAHVGTGDNATAAYPAKGTSPDGSVRGSGIDPYHVVLGIFACGAVGVALWSTRRRRRAQRACTACSSPQLMRFVGKPSDETYLDAGQRVERRLGSVHYQVLVCAGCRASRVLRRNRWRKKFDACASCRYQARSEQATVVREATEDTGGEIRVVQSCAHCGTTQAYARTSPPKPRSSARSSLWGGSRGWASSNRPPSSFDSSSTSFDSSSSSFDSSSSSFSSSSTDTSSSGGSSDGGGAGSSW